MSKKEIEAFADHFMFHCICGDYSLQSAKNARLLTAQAKSARSLRRSYPGSTLSDEAGGLECARFFGCATVQTLMGSYVVRNDGKEG